MMEHEHENVGSALKQIRELTSDFRVLDNARNTWRVKRDALRDLEADLESDLHQHIH